MEKLIESDVAAGSLQIWGLSVGFRGLRHLRLGLKLDV